MSCRHKAKLDALLRDQSVDRGDSNEAANQVTGDACPEPRVQDRSQASTVQEWVLLQLARRSLSIVMGPLQPRGVT